MLYSYLFNVWSCYSKSTESYMLIGSLWLETKHRETFKKEIHELRDQHKIGGEFKWRKITPSRLNFYLDLVDWFFSKNEHLRFRCIAVDHSKVNLMKFHKNDQELGFYKFYYQMLHHWILDWNEYFVFCDSKTNRFQDRIKTLHLCLSNSNLSSQVKNLQAIRSKESVFLQLVDVLTGASGARLNGILGSGTAKEKVVKRIESLLTRPIQHTLKSEQKFNTFIIDLDGGW